MKKVTVYGTGCKSCNETAKQIETFSAANNIDVEIIKEKDLMAIMDAGIMTTPGVAIDGTVVHTGSIPSDAELQKYFA